ncbi:alanine racemase [Faunimonas sp. B44]|uniref:alanine racemase n=1 Tax=Faunimonas sp. B44 TaxID=3461493 RepID=UPI004044BDAB
MVNATSEQEPTGRDAEDAFPAAAGLRLTIDLSALVRNWRRLAGLAAAAECAAVVKADAYGIGLAAAVPALREAGCRTFFVALPEEGAKARALAPDAAIYVLNGFFPEAAALYRAAALRPVLGHRGEIESWASAAGGAPAALHVDTGMNRLGLRPDEAAALPPGLAERAGIALVMSHLACADEPGHELNAVQLARFSALPLPHPAAHRSLANSAGIHLGTAYRFDLVRPGIALYGGASHPDALSEPVATAEARILQVRNASAGETVGYGAAERLARDSRIAILSAGYADGYPRSAGKGERPAAQVFVGGKRLPILGRVSMDLIAVDVTDLPESNVEPGGWAELFGPCMPIDDVAADAGTIAYELLTGLSRRAARRHADGGTS